MTAKPATILNGNYLFEPGVLEFDTDVEIHCCRFSTSALRVSEEWEPNYPHHNIMFMNPQAYKVLLTSTESHLSPNRELPEVVAANYKQYDLILTTDPLVINNCDNAVFFGYGTTWLNKGHIDHEDGLGKFDEEYVKEFWNDKEFGLSFLCSVHNRDSTGYDLRRDLWQKKSSINIPTSFYGSSRNPPPAPEGNPLLGMQMMLRDDNRSILFDSQFSIAIENAPVDNYFTEKLMDCFLTKTVPVYYGCPNIGDFFDERGMINITFDDNVETIIDKINNINENTYESMLPYIEENYKRSLEYCEKTFAERAKVMIDDQINKCKNTDKVLTVGILSLDDDVRRTYMNRLLNVFNSQMTNEHKEKVEIIINSDNGSKTVGEKRNEVLDIASGKYICFVDDDDLVDDKYIETILKVIEQNPEIDAIGFTGMFYVNGNGSMYFKHANQYGGHYKDARGVQHRPINHLNPIRLEIAKQIRFDNKNFGEDSDYCDRLFDSKLIQSEAIIDGITMYHYR